MSHISISHVTQINKSCHTYERALSYVWMKLVTHMNEWCPTNEWVMTHIWISYTWKYLLLRTHVLDLQVDFRIWYAWHDSFIYDNSSSSWHTLKVDFHVWYVSHDSFIYDNSSSSRPTLKVDFRTWYAWHDSFINDNSSSSWHTLKVIFHTWYAWHDSFIYARHEFVIFKKLLEFVTNFKGNLPYLVCVTWLILVCAS